MKKIILSILLVSIIFLSTGCIKTDQMDDINIITTIYPIEYVTNRLYSEHSNIKSIYPKGIDISTYTITEKQINDFAKSDLLIYNGYGEEKDYAIEMLKKNHSLKIIDGTYGIPTKYKETDLWLNPANLLMIAKNIKEQITSKLSNNYIINDIENRYQTLKIDITELEANLKKTVDNAKYKTIVSLDESLGFLEKYGFTVIPLTKEENNEVKINNENLEKFEKLLKDKNISYLFITEGLENDDNLKDIKSKYSFKTLTFRTMLNITEKDQDENEDYLTIMNSNIEILKEEVNN